MKKKKIIIFSTAENLISIPLVHHVVSHKKYKDDNWLGVITACVAPEFVENVIEELKQLNLPFGFKIFVFYLLFFFQSDDRYIRYII